MSPLRRRRPGPEIATLKISVGQPAHLEPGESEGVYRANVPLAQVGVVQLGNQLFAFDSRCPHRAADLTIHGEITGEGRLRCGVHGHVYDLESGLCTDAQDCDPRLETLLMFPAQQEQGHLWVLVPDDHLD